MNNIYETKLLESGLVLEDAKALGIEYLDARECKTLNSSHSAHPALKINYFDPYHNPLSDVPGASPYYRLRYLPERTGFSSQAKLKKKYDNAPRCIPCAYWPQNLDWAPVLNDVTEPVVFVEGEIKASKGCKEGFSTIGLGGVDCWRARKKGVEFLESLKYLTYSRRDVYVCFDSDYLANKNIIRALTQFSEYLDSKGAFVNIITLPSLPGLEKTGLDDFLVYCAKDAVKEFKTLMGKAQPFGFSKTLFSLNKKYILLNRPVGVYETRTQEIYKEQSFKNIVEGGKSITLRIPQAGEKGTDLPTYKYKDVNVANEWLSWPLATHCEALVYSPGASKYVDRTIQGCEYVDYNSWSGWGAEPIEGDVSLFITLVDYLFQDSNPQDKEWFLMWLAYPIQHPGAKLYTACAIHGITHGTGKTLLGYTVGGVYGSNFVEVKQESLESTFSKPFINRQLILGDEITGNDQRKFGDKLKSYITGHEILINDKFVSQYYINNCINFYFTSNHPDAFYLEDSDRRFFIHKSPDTTLEKSFYTAYDKWYLLPGPGHVRRQTTTNALMYYFMNIDTSSFDPHGSAPRTVSKDHMLELSQSDLGSWVRQAKEYPNETLGLSGRDLFNSRELLTHYDPMDKRRVTANGLSRELTRANVVQCYGGKKIRTSDLVVRYYILRNHEKWLNADLETIHAHLKTTKAFMSEQSKY